MIHNSTPGRRHPLAAALIAASVLAISACASTPPPREQMAVSKAAVERVSGSSAAEAPVDAAAAREKFDRATAAMNNKDYVLARQLAEQAEADAALAEAQARATRSDRALAELRDSIRALREELARR